MPDTPTKSGKRKPVKKAFALRLDPAVHAAIERLAANELRSANAQIEVLLRDALKARGVDIPRSKPPRRGRPPKTDETSSNEET